MTFTRENLEDLLASFERGTYLPEHSGYKECADLDGLAAHLFLQSLGYAVLGHHDRGGYGVAYTSCGVTLSTNGYLCRNTDTAWRLHRREGRFARAGADA